MMDRGRLCQNWPEGRSWMLGGMGRLGLAGRAAEGRERGGESKTSRIEGKC